MTKPDFYALLIGIDYYEPNPLYSSLHGAVRDIDKVADYLGRRLKIPSEQITRLTSPFEETHSLASIRAARGETLPTYENIVKAFNEITQTAQAGDIVYIHYSGHGGKAATIYEELKGSGQDDESIVPRDVGDNSRYLRDVEMATLLKRMTDKGLVVSVVFDSCHSGGATRGDCAIRGARSQETDKNKRPIDSLVAQRDELLKNWRILTENNQGEGWLPNRRDCVFLAACRPSEYAYESAFDGSDSNGALTYWMFDTLNNASNLTYQTLYDRLKGMIQSQFSNQLPMLLGEGDRSIFGSDRQSTPYTVTVIEVAEQKVTLDVGAAQGMATGTQFAIYSFNTIDFTDDKKIAVVEIAEIQADRSIAKILTAAQGGIEVKTKIEPGLPCLMLSAPINLIHRVRLFEQKQAGEAEDQLPPELVDRQSATLEPVRQALAGNGWVIEVEKGKEAIFQVAVGKEGEYEICQRGIPLKNLGSPLTLDNPDAPKEVVKRLVHLAKYTAAQMIDNQNSELSDALIYELLDGNKQPFSNPNNIVLQSGDIVHLRVKNTSAKPLNIAVLDFEATWEISQIPVRGDRSAFYELSKNEDTYTKLRFKVPDTASYDLVRETLKLFATRGLANFHWLKLPPLDQPFQSKAREMEQELADKAKTTKGPKGEKLPISPINQLIALVGADLVNPPVLKSIRAEYVSDPNADWVTKSITVTVKR